MNCKKEPFWAKNNKDKWLQLEFNVNFLKKVNNYIKKKSVKRI